MLHGKARKLIVTSQRLYERKPWNIVENEKKKEKSFLGTRKVEFDKKRIHRQNAFVRISIGKLCFFIFLFVQPDPGDRP